MQTVSASKQIAIAEGVQWVESRGEYVFVDTRRERLFGIDSVGADAFRRLVEGEDLDTVMDGLLDTYDVERELLERDLGALLTSLQEQGLIRMQGSAS